MEYLLDDYLILYLDTKEEKYLSAAVSKLLNCGFNENTAVDIIKVEIDIIKYRDYIPKPIIKEIYWLDKIDWFSKDKNAHILDKDINNYVMLRFDMPTSAISNYTFTLSELCAIFDEAWSICHRFKDIVPENMYEECLSIAKEENLNSWVIREFKTRIEGIYRDVNNINADYTKLVASKEINNLYDKELNILMSQKRFNQFNEKA